jgi:hypothetical protein
VYGKRNSRIKFPFKFKFSKKATKIEKNLHSLFNIIYVLCSRCQIDSEDFVIFVAFLENMNFM